MEFTGPWVRALSAQFVRLHANKARGEYSVGGKRRQGRAAQAASSKFQTPSPKEAPSSNFKERIKRESAMIGPRVCDPQRLRCLESVRIGRERLEHSDVAAAQPRSGGSIKRSTTDLRAI